MLEWGGALVRTNANVYHVITSYSIHYTKLYESFAKEDAVRHGGHLATIASEEEHLRLVACVGTNAFGGHDAWIGASDADSEGDWRWVTGEEFKYARWEGGNPDNAKGNEHYAGYWRKPWDRKYPGP